MRRQRRTGVSNPPVFELDSSISSHLSSISETATTLPMPVVRKSGTIAAPTPAEIDELELCHELYVKYRRDSSVMAYSRINAAKQRVLYNRRVSINNAAIIQAQSARHSLWNTDYPLNEVQQAAERSYIEDGMFLSGDSVSTMLSGLTPQHFNVAVAFRPTATVSQSGIAAGFPVKPIEIKNKTGKIEDYFIIKTNTLGRQYEKEDILGYVLHYNPIQLNWPGPYASNQIFNKVAEQIYINCKTEIEAQYNTELYQDLSIPGKFGTMMVDSHTLCPFVTFDTILKTVKKRYTEFLAEEEIYKDLAIKQPGLIKRDTPFVKLRNYRTHEYEKVVGDHDLFCFCSLHGSPQKIFPRPLESEAMLERLMQDPAVMAQHGGIYYWETKTEFEANIKQTIIIMDP